MFTAETQEKMDKQKVGAVKFLANTKDSLSSFIFAYTSKEN